jgi:hypothetical protein
LCRSKCNTEFRGPFFHPPRNFTEPRSGFAEIVLAGYAFHNGKLLFERLAEQKRLRPQLRILFHEDVPRRGGDTIIRHEQGSQMAMRVYRCFSIRLPPD